MDEEPVGDLERALGQVLVGAVDRVAGLEGDDALPAALGEGLRDSSAVKWRMNASSWSGRASTS